MAVVPTGDFRRDSEELLQWSVSRRDGSATVFLAGVIDLSTAERLGDLLEELLEEEPLLVAIAVDVSGVSFLDSSGINCLIGAASSAARTGSDFVVQSPTNAIKRVFAICGVDEILLHPSLGCATGDR